MKRVTTMLYCILLGYYSLNAQNPNWTLPPEQLDVPFNGLTNLPQPSGSSPEEVYQGAKAEYSHGAYSDVNGELLFFSVDNYFYDKNGYGLTHLYQGSFGSGELRGYSEKLILPMGDDCKRYAIIFPDKATIAGGFSSTSAKLGLYMAVYDVEGTNAYNSNAVGEIESIAGNTTMGNNFTDIAERDGQLYSTATEEYYGYSQFGTQANYRSFLQIAATGLIDGCFYYVYVYDGFYLIRYKLTENDLEWDGYAYQVPNGGDNACDIRSEMELIELANGNYRIALPKCDNAQTNVGIIDIDGSTGDVIASSYDEIDLGHDSNNNNAYPHGLEFNATGDYLYMTHAANLNLPNALDVWDVSVGAFLSSLPTLTGISNFRDGFIERTGNKMVIAGDNALGELTGIDNPSSSLSFDPTWRSISSGYGNDAGESFGTFFRYLLPDQIDMTYPDVVEDMSCACCREYSGDAQKYATTQNESWDQSFNSITGSGTNIRISQELRIRKGTTLDLSDLNFYFGKDAKVIVERGDGTVPGGQLILNNTVFTLDEQCIPETYDPCDSPGECDYLFWKGVRVEGVASEDQPTSGFTNQGKMTMRNNSMIEYAEVGIWTNNDGCNNCGGGILTLENSTFKDNVTGIYFDSYVRMAGGNETFNRSIVRANNFTRTGDIPFNSKLTHVRVKNSSTINLRGNIYQNETWQNYDIEFRGIGIHSTNSSISEEWLCATAQAPCPNRIRSKFLNLHKGIDATSTSSTRTLSEGYAMFTNNYIGIQASNLQRPLILDNEFYVINETNASGLKLIQCDQYTVENNFFTAMTTSPVAWMFGITVQSSGPYVNELYRNRFEDITIGIVSSGQNADCATVYRDGLRWKCNRFDQTIPYADIFVYNGNVSDDQGECDATLKPARNIFSHTNGFDIRVRDTGTNLIECSSGGSTAFFDIHYDYNEIPALPTPVQARLEPLYYTNLRVVPNECYTAQGTFLPNANDCPVQRTSLDDINDVLNIAKSGDEEITMDALTEEAIYLYSMEDSWGEGEFAQADYDFWSKLSEAYQWDTLGNFSAEEIYNLINEYQPQSTGAKFAKMLSQKIGVETPEWISSDYALSTDVQNLPLTDDSDELPSVLFDVTDSGDLDSYSYILALNELYAEHQQTYDTWIPEPLDLELPEEFDSEGSKSSSQTESSLATIRPNPFLNLFNLVVNVEENFSDLKVIIHDVLGRQLSSHNYGEVNQVEIDGSNFPSGVLIYSVYLDGKLFETGRIVKSE